MTNCKFIDLFSENRALPEEISTVIKVLTDRLINTPWFNMCRPYYGVDIGICELDDGSIIYRYPLISVYHHGQFAVKNRAKAYYSFFRGFLNLEYYVSVLAYGLTSKICSKEITFDKALELANMENIEEASRLLSMLDSKSTS